MKIIHITTGYPPRLGGMENVVKELAERTAGLGHDVSVFTSSIKGSLKTEKKGRLTVHRLFNIGINRVPDIMPSLPFKLLRSVDSKTIIHVHYVLNPFIDIAFAASKFRRAKIVTHLHIDPSPTGVFGCLNPSYKEHIWKNVLPASNVVICQTQDFVEVAVGYNVPRSKCVVVPNGVDRTKFKYRNSTTITSPIKILFVGRLNKQKNIPRLLEAFKLFQKNHQVVLRIIGEGEDRKMIEDYIKDNNISNIEMAGVLTGEKLAAAYASSDIFVLTSDAESFPLVLLEASASGIPIVASNIPGVREFLKGIAVLVEPNPENFAAAMANLVEDSQLRKELVSKASEKVSNYDWDRITEQVVDIYRKIN
jgi:glycosyltransferase involved in cell wall biosynthesis